MDDVWYDEIRRSLALPKEPESTNSILPTAVTRWQEPFTPPQFQEAPFL
jgi:hypothetical protein